MSSKIAALSPRVYAIRSVRNRALLRIEYTFIGCALATIDVNIIIKAAIVVLKIFISVLLSFEISVYFLYCKDKQLHTVNKIKVPIHQRKSPIMNGSACMTLKKIQLSVTRLVEG